VRKDESGWQISRYPEHGHYAFEVMSIRAQAMQPDHTGKRFGIGFDYNTRRIIDHLFLSSCCGLMHYAIVYL
jgi:hypothetical protein